jgi:hypothetical protein
MVQGVHRPVNQNHVPPGVHVVPQAPQHLGPVLDVHLPVKNQDHLGEHHLPQPPEGVHDLAGVAGVAFVDGHKGQIVKHPLHRQVQVHDFRQGFLDQGKKNALRGLGHEAVLHGGLPHDGGGIHGLTPPGQGGDVKHRILIRQGIIAGVVPERPLPAPFPRLHIALQHDLGTGRHLRAAH